MRSKDYLKILHPNFRNVLKFRDELKFSKDLSEFEEVNNWISEFNHTFSEI